MSSGHLKSGSGLPAVKITQNLVDGDNTINHGLAKEVVSWSIKDSNGIFKEFSVNIIDNNNINVNLAGGGPLNNSVILLSYID